MFEVLPATFELSLEDRIEANHLNKPKSSGPWQRRISRGR